MSKRKIITCILLFIINMTIFTIIDNNRGGEIVWVTNIGISLLSCSIFLMFTYKTK